MQSAMGAFCVAVLCVASIACVAADTEWVTVATTADAETAEPTPVSMMEVASQAAAAMSAQAVDELATLSLAEVGATAHSTTEADFSSMSEAGTLGLSVAEQEAIIADALEELEVEFIHDYGTDGDRVELDSVLDHMMAEEDAENDNSDSSDSEEMRFASRGGFRGFLRRLFGRRHKKQAPPPAAPAHSAPAPAAPAPPPPAAPANIAAQCARLGFVAGNTSPQGLAAQAGPSNAQKMGGGFFSRLGKGLQNFAGRAGNWFAQRFGRGGPAAPPPAPPAPAAQGPEGPAAPPPAPPAPAPQPPAQGQKRGWLGRIFDKVKSGAKAVAGAIGKAGNKIGGWGAGIAKFGKDVFGNTKIGKFLNSVGKGMNKWGNIVGQIGDDIVWWLNGVEVKKGTRGAVMRPKNLGPPKPGEPGGLNGPKITPGMPGTYKDAKGKWRGPDGRRVYTAQQQLKYKLRKEERKAARDARREARDRRKAEKRRESIARDKKELARHLAWRREKLEEKAERLRKRKNRLDYSGVDPDYPGAGWRKHTPEEVEDCMACRYVWLQVEMDIGNTEMEDNVYDSFNQNALEAMKQPIFYPAVQMMYDAVDDMIGDYMDGMAVNQICENSLMCRMPEN